MEGIKFLFLVPLILASFAFAPSTAFAQSDNLPPDGSSPSSDTVKTLTQNQLLSIWNKNFSTLQYYEEPDTGSGSLPMSPICIGDRQIAPPKAKHPLVLLKLERIFIDQPPATSIAPPNYLYFFKATFPDEMHNPYYQNWLHNGGVSISYIGIELDISTNNQGSQTEAVGSVQGFNMILYSSSVLKGQTSLTYDYLNSYPATQLGYVGPLTGCQ